MSPEDIAKFFARIEKGESCWRWTGHRNRQGYGALTIRGKTYLAHRAVYEHIVGPVPAGLVLDHVKARGCTTRDCVNPDHLEPVSQRVNLLRSTNQAARNATATRCKRGHEFTPENTRRDVNGKRRCRACHRNEAREAYRVEAAATGTLGHPSASTINAARTHCIKGHELAGRNILPRLGRRGCRMCKNDRARARRAAAGRIGAQGEAPRVEILIEAL